MKSKFLSVYSLERLIAGDVAREQHAGQHDAHRVGPVVELTGAEVDADGLGGLLRVGHRLARGRVDDAVRRRANEVIADAVERLD